MTGHTSCRRSFENEEAVITAVEYIVITGILMVMLIITVLTVNHLFIEGPSDTLRYNSYLDTGERLSARIVDMEMLAPESGRIVTRLDIPLEVAGKSFNVSFVPEIAGSGGNMRSVAVGDGRVACSVPVIGGDGGVLKGNFTGYEYTLEYDSGGS